MVVESTSRNAARETGKRCRRSSVVESLTTDNRRFTPPRLTRRAPPQNDGRALRVPPPSAPAMRTLRSAVSAVPLSLALVLGSATVDAQTPTAGSRPRLQGDAWRAAGTAGICGKGSYEFKLAGAKAGNESFETTCLGSGAAGGGYASAAHTIFSVPGAAIDLVTTLEV